MTPAQKFMSETLSDLAGETHGGETVNYSSAHQACQDIYDYFQPTWSKETPTEPGDYWWTDGKVKPIKITGLKKGGDIVIITLFSCYIPLAEKGGYWMEYTTPELPKEEV